MLESEGHKSTYISTALSYLESLKDMLTAYSLHVLPPLPDSSTTILSHDSSLSLQGKQHAAYQTFKLFLASRYQFYNSTTPVDVNWKQFMLITGKPGTGKSYLVRACIEYAIIVAKTLHTYKPGLEEGLVKN